MDKSLNINPYVHIMSTGQMGIPMCPYSWSYSQMWCTRLGGFPVGVFDFLFSQFLSVDEFYTLDDFAKQFVPA